MNFEPKPGEKNPNAILTWEKVRMIRKTLERSDEKGIREKLAKRYKVSPRTIASIAIGSIWREGKYNHVFVPKW